MNLDWNEAMTLMAEVAKAMEGMENGPDVALFPPFPYLRHFHEFLKDKGSVIEVGAQDCSAHKSGAYTGEVSASMIKSVGAKYCIIGHSERRQYHRESSDVLASKVMLALENGLTPIFCVGETYQERQDENQTFVIDQQMDGALFELSPEDFSKLIIAYEPVWAIGTGMTATSEQAQDMHEFIRALIQSKYGSEVARQCRILYGGSVKPDNATEIFSQPDVDGGLIGGASLKVADFMGIVRAAID